MDELRAREHVITSWLQHNAIPILHLEAGNGFTDLQPLKRILNDVKIVGLGEATHGTREFFQVKHRLVEFLVTEMSFTVFAMEASHAACQPINDYVLEGKGERAAVLAGQHYVAWDTEEFSALLDWLRAYNTGVSDDRKVTFLGLDVTFNDYGRQAVLEYLSRVAPDRIAATDALLGILAREEAKWPMRIDDESEAAVKEVLPELRELIMYLGENRDELVSRSSAAEFDRILMFTRVMPQLWTGGSPGRSRHMAENLLRHLDRQSPGARVVVWAHNGHVGVETPPGGERRMGQVLHKRFGDAYFACALEFHQGSCQSRTVRPDGYMGDLMEVTVGPAPAGSLPWHLSRADIENFMVSLRTPPENPVVKLWLDTPQNQHGIGWGYVDPSAATEDYEEVTIGRQYDGIVFVERSTPVRPTETALATVARRGDF